MESWHKAMPDYEFVHWDMDKISSIDSIFLKEALAMKKWAFAADFVRIWAVHKEGGIYLDTDVIAYKSFDDLLDNELFIGSENSLHINSRLTERYLTSHCFGAIANHPYLKKCLEYYQGRHFVQCQSETLPESLKYDITLLPFIQSEVAKQWGYCPYPSVKDVQILADGMKIFTPEYFDCIKILPKTYCKHLAVGGWRTTKRKEEKITFAYKIQRRIRALMENVLDKFGYLMIKKL